MVAVLIHEAIGEQLTCVFVDHGLLRLGEAAQVVRLFRDSYNIPHPAPQPSKKICMTMSISENLVRRSECQADEAVSNKRQMMRVMVFVKATDDSEKGILPTTRDVRGDGQI